MTIIVLAALVYAGVQVYEAHHSNVNLAVKQQVPTHIYDAWVHYKSKFSKKYGAGEEALRLQNFQQNFQKIAAHTKKQATYTLGPNQFMDMSKEEFKARVLTLNVPEVTTQEFTGEQLNTNDLPDSVDWRTKSAVTDVKDQGQCGSCWAFSATGSMESAAGVKGSKLPLLSEQELVDCSKTFQNQGCNGGWMDNAFKYVMKNGLSTEDQYPYRAVDQSCKKVKGDYKITGFKDVAKGDIAQLAAAAAQQPVSIAVDAEEWQFYSGGVFSNCGSQLDHGVLLVGYTPEAWIVKNSWASSWGENGYIRLKRGNTCALANAASYPTL